MSGAVRPRRPVPVALASVPAVDDWARHHGLDMAEHRRLILISASEHPGSGCEECGGRGMIDCPDCEGTSEVECECFCGNEHTAPCEHCHETGEVPCPECADDRAAERAASALEAET